MRRAKQKMEKRLRAELSHDRERVPQRLPFCARIWHLFKKSHVSSQNRPQMCLKNGSLQAARQKAEISLFGAGNKILLQVRCHEETTLPSAQKTDRRRSPERFLPCLRQYLLYGERIRACTFYSAALRRVRRIVWWLFVVSLLWNHKKYPGMHEETQCREKGGKISQFILRKRLRPPTDLLPGNKSTRTRHARALKRGPWILP